MSEANVVTNDNLAEFYANRLGLSDSPEPVAVDPAEPAPKKDDKPTDAEPEAGKEPKKSDRMEKRFSKLTRKAAEAEERASAAERRLAELEQRNQPAEPVTPPPTESQGLGEKPNADNYRDAFEYAEALADWSAKKALHERDQQEINRKAEAEQKKVIEGWQSRVEAAKKDIPDWEEVVGASKVEVPDAVRDAILDSDVGAQLLYALASDEDYARELASMPVTKALRELGKLEAAIETPQVKKEPKATPPAKSKAPEPISPLRGGKAGADVLLDDQGSFHGTYAQWKASRKAGRIR